MALLQIVGNVMDGHGLVDPQGIQELVVFQILDAKHQIQDVLTESVHPRQNVEKLVELIQSARILVGLV